MKGNMGFINEFDINPFVLEAISGTKHVPEVSKLHVEGLGFHFQELLMEKEVSLINGSLDKQAWIPVGKDGIKSNYKENDEIGSWRLSTFEPQLADAIWSRMKDFFPQVRIMNPWSPTDWDGSYEWEPIGINPLFRFIRYNKNGVLIPHYDAPFIQDYEVRSLSSLVIYLSDNPTSGGTRFLKDEQTKLDLKDRDYSDWKEEAGEDRINLKVNPSKGDALVFDHRILHDSERMKDDSVKTIVRTDIMYKRVR